MSVAVIGGLDRLARIYQLTGKSMGWRVRHFPRKTPSLAKRLASVDAVVLFTGVVSHHLLREVNQTVRQLNIPIAYCSSASATGLKNSLAKLNEVVASRQVV